MLMNFVLFVHSVADFAVEMLEIQIIKVEHYMTASVSVIRIFTVIERLLFLFVFILKKIDISSDSF